MTRYSAKDWTTRPISPTCEVGIGSKTQCGKPTTAAYPAMGCGWMALCDDHAKKHRPHVFDVDELIECGETWE